MERGEIDYLRSRIAAERRMAEGTSCPATASAHMRMARAYELRLEAEAGRIVETARPMDERMAQAMRRIT